MLAHPIHLSWTSDFITRHSVVNFLIDEAGLKIENCEEVKLLNYFHPIISRVIV